MTPTPGKHDRALPPPPLPPSPAVDRLLLAARFAVFALGPDHTAPQGRWHDIALARLLVDQLIIDRWVDVVADRVRPRPPTAERPSALDPLLGHALAVLTSTDRPLDQQLQQLIRRTKPSLYRIVGRILHEHELIESWTIRPVGLGPTTGYRIDPAAFHTVAAQLRRPLVTGQPAEPDVAAMLAMVTATGLQAKLTEPSPSWEGAEASMANGAARAPLPDAVPQLISRFRDSD